MVHVEVVFVTKDKTVFQKFLNLEDGMTVADAIKESAISLYYPETALLPVGIFSQKVSLTTILKDGDRIEIYRPLLIDPKEKRRLLSLKK